MPKISVYPDGSPARNGDQVVIRRGGANYKLPVETLIPGYIQENACQLVYGSATSYSCAPGAAYVNGEILTWAASIVRSALALATASTFYTYLYKSAGIAALEESTTVPVWNGTHGYFQKTGDASRRCIGYLHTSAINTISKFINIVMGRNSEILFVDGVVRSVVSGGAISASWQSFTLSPFVPSRATHFLALEKEIFGNINDDASLGMSPIDLGAGIAGNLGPYVIRNKGVVAGQTITSIPTWAMISTALTYYYRLTQNVGTTTTAQIQVQGARFIR